MIFILLMYQSSLLILCKHEGAVNLILVINALLSNSVGSIKSTLYFKVNLEIAINQVLSELLILMLEPDQKYYFF